MEGECKGATFFSKFLPVIFLAARPPVAQRFTSRPASSSLPWSFGARYMTPRLLSSRLKRAGLDTLFLGFPGRNLFSSRSG